MKKTNLRMGMCLLMGLLTVGCAKNSSDDYAQAKKLAANGQYTEAAERFLLASPNHNADAGFLVDMGYNCVELQKYSEAAECFNHAINLEDQLETAYRGLGIAYYEQGLYEDAIAAFNHAIDQVELKVGTQEYDILQYRGKCEIGLEKYQDALKTYDALAQLGVEPANQYLQMGIICLKTDFEEGAAKLFDQALEEKSDDVEMYFAIYQAYCDVDKEPLGVMYLSRALEVEGKSDEAHLWRGKIRYIMGDITAALTELNYPLENKNHEAALYVGFCYEALGRYDDAIALYYDELMNQQNDPVMVNYLAMCLAQKQDDASYNEALNLIVGTLNQLDEFYAKKQGEGQKTGQEEVRVDYPYRQQLAWNAIVLYEKTGHYPSAYTRLVEYQKYYPNDPAIEQEMSFLLMKQT